mgnify:CR=1 FL=1
MLGVFLFFLFFVFFCLFFFCFFVFFFKQKTAYEILTCDWSSDVCSSDLNPTADPVSLTGYTLTLSQIDTIVNIRNIPFEVGNYEYTLTARVRLFNDGEARFQAGEQIYFREDRKSVV